MVLYETHIRLMQDIYETQTIHMSLSDCRYEEENDFSPEFSTQNISLLYLKYIFAFQTLKGESTNHYSMFIIFYAHYFVQTMHT